MKNKPSNLPYGYKRTVLKITIKRYRSTKKFTEENPECTNEGYHISMDDGHSTTSTCVKTWKEVKSRLREWI